MLQVTNARQLPCRDMFFGCQCTEPSHLKISSGSPLLMLQEDENLDDPSGHLTITNDALSLAPIPAAPVPEEATTEDALTETLQGAFGFPAFRGLQLQVIQSVLAGHSTLAVLPTGPFLILLYSHGSTSQNPQSFPHLGPSI